MSLIQIMRGYEHIDAQYKLLALHKKGWLIIGKCLDNLDSFPAIGKKNLQAFVTPLQENIIDFLRLSLEALFNTFCIHLSS